LSVVVNIAKEYEITISDLNGKVLLKQKSKQPISILDVCLLQTGTYLINIKSDQGQYSQKFIKN